jgi:hypothetical protein
MKKTLNHEDTKTRRSFDGAKRQNRNFVSFVSSWFKLFYRAIR